jgi:hypothetical protein
MGIWLVMKDPDLRCRRLAETPVVEPAAGDQLVTLFGHTFDPCAARRRSRVIFRAVQRRLLAQDMLSATEIANPVLLAEDPDRSGLLILSTPRGPRYPAFQFRPVAGPTSSRQLWPLLVEINHRLGGAGTDPWGLTDWWCGPNGQLGAEPRSLLGRPGAARRLRGAVAGLLADPG